MKPPVLFISPPFLPYQTNRPEPCFPLGLGYIASSLEAAGFQVNILDMDGDGPGPDLPSVPFPYPEDPWDILNAVLAERTPDIVGISVMSPKLSNAMEVSARVRELLPDCTLIMGGNHPTALPGRLLEKGFADFIVRGEGERTMVELCMALDSGLGKGEDNEICGLSYMGSQGVSSNPPRPLIEDLDSLPLPGRHLMMNGYCRSSSWAGIMTSRGCPYRCTFCASRSMWGRRVRYRSVSDVMEEVDQVVRQYGSTYIRFFDDTFTMKRERLKDLCEAVGDYRPVLTWEATTRVDQLDPDTVSLMASSGCTKVYIGIESGSPRVRERIHKDEPLEMIEPVIRLLNRHGILSVGFYMAGMPSETVEDMEKTRLLIDSLKTSYTALANYTMLPGSDDFNNSPGDRSLNEDGNYFLPSEEYLASLPEDIAAMTIRMHSAARAHDMAFSTRARRILIKLRQRIRHLSRSLGIS